MWESFRSRLRCIRRHVFLDNDRWWIFLPIIGAFAFYILWNKHIQMYPIERMMDLFSTSWKCGVTSISQNARESLKWVHSSIIAAMTREKKNSTKEIFLMISMTPILANILYPIYSSSDDYIHLLVLVWCQVWVWFRKCNSGPVESRNEAVASCMCFAIMYRWHWFACRCNAYHSYSSWKSYVKLIPLVILCNEGGVHRWVCTCDVTMSATIYTLHFANDTYNMMMWRQHTFTNGVASVLLHCLLQYFPME